MIKSLQDELNNSYCGKIICEEYVNWMVLEDRDILSAKDTIDDCTEITISMMLSIEVNDKHAISDISIDFSTSCWGDSGIGESDPRDYFSYEECYSAASNYIQDLLDTN